MFKKEKDEGRSRLHSARFQQLSILEPDEWYKQALVMRVDVIKNILLTHVGGTNCVSEKVIIMMHDCKIALTMKHFIVDTVAVACKLKVMYTSPGGSTHSDIAWVKTSTLAPAQDEILNYSVLIHHLYTCWNTTGFIIQRVLLKHKWLASYSVMTNNRCVPMSYKEQPELLESITDRIHNPSNSRGGGNPAQNSGFKIPRSTASNPGLGHQGASGSKKLDKRARWNGLLLCYDYNSMKGTVWGGGNIKLGSTIYTPVTYMSRKCQSEAITTEVLIKKELLILIILKSGLGGSLAIGSIITRISCLIKTSFYYIRNKKK